MPKTSQKSRRNFWEEHIQEWRSSKLSKAKYCEEQRISKSAFYRWLKKIKNFKNNSKFIPISIERKNNKGNYCTVEIGNNGKIIIEKKEVITELLKIVRMAKDV